MRKLRNSRRPNSSSPTKYVQWLANIVSLMKKNGKLRVCVDFRDLNVDTPKDMYEMPIADMLVDSPTNNELLSFMDGLSVSNSAFGLSYGHGILTIYEN